MLTKEKKDIFDFLKEHLRTKKVFTKEQFLALQSDDINEKTKKTYFLKQYAPLLRHLDDGSYQVHESFRKYATEGKFERYTSQKRKPWIDYKKESYQNLIMFEFFMPLANENYLRDALDELFYKDTILPRLKNVIGLSQLKELIIKKQNEEVVDYLDRVCQWISNIFVGYSIQHVQGRFKTRDILTLHDAAEAQKKGDNYLIDETTAIVKFIFPVGPPSGDPKLDDFIDADKDMEVKNHAKRIRVFFHNLFVQPIVDIVGEDEIWMIESGMKNQLHVWRREE